MQCKRDSANVSEMDIYDEPLRRLRRDKRPANEIERESGVPAETVRDLRNGITTDPRLSTVKKLASHYGIRREAA